MDAGSATDTVVIVGAGLAGAKAAESLRGWRFAGRIVLVGDEPEAPYERPSLSKGYLRGRGSADGLRVHDPGYYAAHGIELRTATTVAAVDVERRRVVLEQGGALHYDRLLLATGARPRRLVVPGADLDGVHPLRTIADADAIRAAAPPGSRALVVGAGWLGCEAAATLRRAGVEVTLVCRDELPFLRSLGPAVGAVYRDVHVEHGVDLRTGTSVTAFTGGPRVSGAKLSDGTLVGCDVAVVAVGAAPAVEPAISAGIATGEGITVDRFLRTSAPDVFAVGDVATVDHPILDRRVRTGHWWAALTQSPVAAANMLGRRAAYDWVPYFGSRQYDLDVEYVGHGGPDDEVVYRGEPATRRFIAFWLRDQAVTGALNVGVWGAAPLLKRAVAGRRRVDPDRLTDPHAPLDQALAVPPASSANPRSLRRKVLT